MVENKDILVAATEGASVVKKNYRFRNNANKHRDKIYYKSKKVLKK